MWRVRAEEPKIDVVLKSGQFDSVFYAARIEDMRLPKSGRKYR